MRKHPKEPIDRRLFEAPEWYALVDQVRLLAVRMAGVEARMNMATKGPEEKTT